MRKAISFLSFSRNLAPFSRNYVSLWLNFNLFSRSFCRLSCYLYSFLTHFRLVSLYPLP
ncbi:hypothetical protein HMPREF9999_00194 [Alloprevotella sp. oral taxon 473 str. F0040]|nr:hypothetical protein HMPREF9999_00194 [Alloprevotella sp. oral taxon 473 str. F0040]